MKKVVSLVLAVVLLFALSATSFAVDSPTAANGPQVLEFSTETGASGRIVVTAYLNRSTLSTQKRELLEKAYAVLQNAASVAGLVGLSGDLSVSDVFDVSWVGDDELNPGKITITLSASLLGSFKALLHFNGSAWEIVADAAVSADKASLTFTATDLSPFAIVVSSNAGSGNFVDSEPTSPQTNDASAYVMVAGLGLLACAGLFLAISRKKSAVEE